MTDRYYRLLDDVTDLVRQDGQPRQAGAVDQDGAESIHMLFLDGDAVCSVLLADWAAEQQVLAAKEAERQAAAQLRQKVLATAQSAVGVALDQLTTAQRNALIALLLYDAGALDNDGKVRPLGKWVR